MTSPEAPSPSMLAPERVLAPPPGPGVVPPFATPPTDRDYKGLWIGLGVGGLLLVLCCVGGAFGFGVLVSGSEGLVRAESQAVVRQYLQALQTEDYEGAYDQLCARRTLNTSLERFRDLVTNPPVVAFQINNVEITDEIVVNTTVERRGLVADQVPYPVVQESNGFKVCRI